MSGIEYPVFSLDLNEERATQAALKGHLLARMADAFASGDFEEPIADNVSAVYGETQARIDAIDVAEALAFESLIKKNDLEDLFEHKKDELQRQRIAQIIGATAMAATVSLSFPLLLETPMINPLALRHDSLEDIKPLSPQYIKEKPLLQNTSKEELPKLLHPEHPFNNIHPLDDQSY